MANDQNIKPLRTGDEAVMDNIKESLKETSLKYELGKIYNERNEAKRNDMLRELFKKVETE